VADHPYTDPGDGRTQCETCGKYVWLVTHSCKGVRVAPAAAGRCVADRDALAEKVAQALLGEPAAYCGPGYGTCGSLAVSHDYAT
jgi:hypothetical protein